MSRITIDKLDGMISVKDSYEDKDRCQAAGCFWDSVSKTWKMAFTTSTLERLLDLLPHADIDEDIPEKLEIQAEKEKKLAEIKELAVKNQDINFRVPGLKVTPFPYQKLGILYSITNGSGMLIGDSMGLGKTIQGISTAVVLKNQGKIKNCLVVTPASLKYNWPLEIQKFTDEECIVIDAKNPEDRVSQWVDDSKFFKIANYELIVEDLGVGREIRTPKNMTQEQKEKMKLKKLHNLVKQKRLESVKNKVWDLIIMDECHALKHTSSKRYQAIKNLKAKMKIGLSGTPMDGRLEELFTVMNIICPGVLGSRESFWVDHVVKDIYGSVKGYKNLLEVQKKISPFFIRRLKKDVLKDLPEKLYENKIIALSDEEMRIYKKIKAGKHPCVTKPDGEPCDAVVRAIRCMQFVNFPQMLEPSCKTTTKLDIFEEVVEELVKLNGQKVIIFTQFKELLNVVDKLLKEMGIKFLRIDGDTDKKVRASYQKIFNEDLSIDAIIGTEAMSTGLNLIGGDTVINLTQSWQPAFMSQREDRSYRIGRKENVTVLNFLCKDTIEEKIRKVLYSKDKITSNTLGDGTDEAVLLKMGKEEIESML